MHAAAAFALLALAAGPFSTDGNRLSYLDDPSPYYPHTNFPKLITPQWVGEEGVEAVVILAIDDMRDTAVYESYLRPILQRLKAIDGRAPVSIMTCAIKPDDPQLQTWLEEGLSLEVHTFDHPCPLLQGKFEHAKATYDKCVDLMFDVPHNAPVAFRMPCCDSLNTVSPRFYAEIFNKTTAKDHFLQISSSVFQLYTARDPSIPRELLLDDKGEERFRKYFPNGLPWGGKTNDRFVNYIENYPYPYVVNRQCWEFPCMTPSDWEGNFLHKPNNPQTVEDMQAALDITVHKQGVLSLVFHPHGWIKAEQVNQLVDHAVAKHGKKIKFLTFKEALERLNQNVLGGETLRSKDGADNGARLIDINEDGFLDAVVSNEKSSLTRIWRTDNQSWHQSNAHVGVPGRGKLHRHLATDVFWLSPNTIYGLSTSGQLSGCWTWSWSPEGDSAGGWGLNEVGFPPRVKATLPPGGRGLWSCVAVDLDGSGVPEILIQQKGTTSVAVFSMNDWDAFIKESSLWKLRGATLPPGTALKPEDGSDVGTRFIDINEDGKLDLVFSDAHRYGVWLFKSLEKGWSTELLSGKRGDGNPLELPPIVQADGTNNGFFVQGRALHWMNEDTATLKNLVVSIDFDQLLGDRMPVAKSPQAALESMRPRPGFVVELMAAEPLVMDPVSMHWGADGKLWIAEMADYPNGIDGKGQPGGRVRFLDDEDGDGFYDKSTLFLENVGFPSGVFPWKQGVLVSAAPEIFYAEDTDGDGKADRRETLYSGFVEGNQQHRVNGFEWGLDGWLYLANGDSGGVVKSEKTGETVDIRGRDLRIHPETGRIEAVAGQAQFGRRRDDWGRWYGNNNSNPMFQYVYEDRYLSRNPHYAAPAGRRDVSVVPGPSPIFPASKTLTRFNEFHSANRFTSACSAMVYRDELVLPSVQSQVPSDGGSAFTGHLALGTALTFVSEPVHNLVHCEVARQEGVATVSERLPDEAHREFLASTDNWFRPTMVTTGPDGGIWIADMYRLVIEHPEWIPIEWQQKLNLRDGADRGRLWRVRPYGAQLRAVPRLAGKTSAELVAALDSPNGWQRDTAHRLLLEAGDKAAAANLTELIATAERPVSRMQALCVLAGLDGLTEPLLTKQLGDEHAGVRRHALQLAEQFPAPGAELLAAITKCVEDSDDEVRLQLAFTLGELRSPEAGELLGRLAVCEVEHPWIAPAAMTSLNARNLPGVVTAALAATRDGQDVSGLLQTLIAQTVAWKNLAGQLALLELACPAEGEPAVWQSIALREFLQALQRQGISIADWTAALSVDQSSGAEGLQGALARAATLATNADAAIELRTAAIALLGWRPAAAADEAALLAELLQPQESPAVQQAAIAAAGRWSGEAGAKILAGAWMQLAPAQRTAAADLLLARPVGLETLLKALEAEQIPAATIDAQTRQRLVEHRDEQVSARAGKLFQAAGASRQVVVEQYRPSLKLTVDPQRGAQVFARLCSTCHKLQEKGFAVGPDLAALVDKSPEAMLVAILDPNRAVESKFFNYTAVTENGLTYQGLLAEESAGSLTLMAAEGRRQTVLRADLEEFFTASKSLMPEGLEKDLPPADLAHLIGYIRSNVPLPQRKEFPGNAPKLVTAGDDGNLVLRPADAEIYGSTLVLEEKYGNLGYWSSVDDQAVWVVTVPEAGKYAVKVEWARDPQATAHKAVIAAGKQPLTFAVAPTAGWDDYQTQVVGELELEPGEQRVTIHPAARPLPALMDLKSVVLERVR